MCPVLCNSLKEGAKAFWLLQVTETSLDFFFFFFKEINRGLSSVFKFEGDSKLQIYLLETLDIQWTGAVETEGLALSKMLKALVVLLLLFFNL